MCVCTCVKHARPMAASTRSAVALCVCHIDSGVAVRQGENGFFLKPYGVRRPLSGGGNELFCESVSVTANLLHALVSPLVPPASERNETSVRIVFTSHPYTHPSPTQCAIEAMTLRVTTTDAFSETVIPLLRSLGDVRM